MQNQSIYQLRWQSFRSFNLAIVFSLCFFFLTGILQSYTVFNASPVFITFYYFPLLLLVLLLSLLIGLIRNNSQYLHIITPITCALLTLFISINSYWQYQENGHDLLPLLLLFPFFYYYLLAFNIRYLLINNVLVVTCYLLTAITIDTNIFSLLSNSLFLLTLCFITTVNQLRNRKEKPQRKMMKKRDENIISPKTNRYLNRIIHDIRQPLSSLSLYGQLLENKLQSSPHYQLAKNVKLASEDLDRWLSALLDLSRLDSGTITVNFNDFSLTSALSPLIKKHQFMADQSGVKMNVRLPEIQVTSDQRFLTEIVDVLLNNALLHSTQKKSAKVLLSVRHYQGKALLQVWNQGEKIPEQLINILFDEIALADNPIHNKSKGIGLGLPIAQRKAKLCKTNIKVATDNNGSCFSLELDLAQNVIKSTNLNSLANTPANFKILLIDDDQGILNALSMLLENWGYNVDCADTAETGLQQFNLKSYHLVITDYRFSTQQTGLDVIKAIKNINDIPAILLTGEADPNKLKEVQDLAKKINYKILHKPVKPASLRFLLTQLLK